MIEGLPGAVLSGVSSCGVLALVLLFFLLMSLVANARLFQTIQRLNSEMVTLAKASQPMLDKYTGAVEAFTNLVKTQPNPNDVIKEALRVFAERNSDTRHFAALRDEDKQARVR